jgi:integrase
MCFYRDPITEKRTSSSRATLAQASRMFDDIEAMLNAAEHGVLVAQRATVTDLATRHIESETARLDAGDIRSGTLDNTKRICRLHIIPVIGEVLVEQWGPDESREVLTAARNRGYEDLASIKKVLSALFSEAQVKPRLLSPGKNPLHKVSLPKHRGGEQGASQMYVPPDQRPETLTMRRLIVAVWLVGKQRSEPWLHVMIRLAAFGGLRFSELVALRARDYDPTTRTVLVQRTIEERNGKQAEAPTKNTRRRAVPIPRSADRFLLRRVKQVLAQEPGTGRWPLGGPDGLLFPGPGGNPWTRKYFRLMVYLPGCERIGWTTVTKAGNPTPRMHFHALRHHCATFWLASPPKGPGLAMEEAAQRMGHSVRVMQETYINPSEYARERIATALDRF